MNILEGQVAIVTGGGRGIGRATALALATAGAKVAVAARSTNQLVETVQQIEQSGGRALALTVDVTDPQGVEQMVTQVEQQLGSVDLLVNNAGIGGRSGPIRATDAETWWRVLDVNLRGAFLCAQAVLPSMTTRRRGRIVSVSSGASLGPWPYVSAYAISKAALNRFSETLALEVADDSIAVFSLDPGLVRTAMTDQTDSAEWKKWDDQIPRLFEEGRESPPEMAAQLTVALASGKADILTGRLISISDDLDEMVAQARRIQEEELYLLRMKRL
jgi:NAD(P)-dependent dehydrogenase (short-subunit alcohol dehydrogenase family)